MFIEDEKEEEEGNKHKQVHDSSGKRTKIDSAISLFFGVEFFLTFLQLLLRPSIMLDVL